MKRHSPKRKAPAARLLILCAFLAAGCATKVEVYKKPDQDFSIYAAKGSPPMAIAGFRSDPRLPDTTKGAVEIPLLLQGFMTSKGYPVVDLKRSVAELSTIPAADKELTPDVLAELGKKLQVNAVLSGIVKYYGLYEEEVTPTVRADGRSPASQRRYYSGGYDRAAANRRARQNAPEIRSEYTVTLRLELFDVATKMVVWWGEATVSGDEDKLKTYTEKVFEALFKDFPVPPPGKK